MKKMKIVQFISVGGILTSLAVLLQAAPVFLPAIGLAFSPFSTLPIAIATVLNIYLGISVLFASAFILIIVSLQEAIILLFTTGLLGIVLGTLLYRKGRLISILGSSIALSTGMLVLTYLVAVPAFADFTSSFSFPITLLIFLLFSFIYVTIWFICLRKFINYLIKIKVIKKSDHILKLWG